MLMKPRFAAVSMSAPLWTTPTAPRLTAACLQTAPEAEQTLAALTEKARSVESEPCKITPTFTEESDDVRLDIDFTFACEAEMLIFPAGSALIPLGYVRPCQLLAGAFSFLFFLLCHSSHFPFFGLVVT